MTIADFLHIAVEQLSAAGIPTARLDTLVLLERALKHNKAWLLAHGEELIDAEKLTTLQAQLGRRLHHEPLAYILGCQEFYGRSFIVTPDVLIPRPETETIIETLKELPLPNQAHLLDLGTGSGAIAITAELEIPHLRTEACDISLTALAIAQQNAERLGAHVTFFASDLLASVDRAYDVIVANLPYVAEDWERSPETHFEPALALFAADTGLDLIKKLIASAPQRLTKGGYLVLEADPRQFARIKKAANSVFAHICSVGFTIVLQKV